jgi:hypothetical protein
MAQLLMVGVYQPALGISGALPIDHVVRSNSRLPPAC